MQGRGSQGRRAQRDAGRARCGTRRAAWACFGAGQSLRPCNEVSQQKGTLGARFRGKGWGRAAYSVSVGTCTPAAAHHRSLHPCWESEPTICAAGPPTGRVSLVGEWAHHPPGWSTCLWLRCSLHAPATYRCAAQRLFGKVGWTLNMGGS